MNITEELFSLQDKEYGVFQAKLVPNVDSSKIIGVRVPVLRSLAKRIYKEGNYSEFLSSLPHQYYDEDMLHGLILSEFKDYQSLIEELDLFLPYVDNWAVCDIMSPQIFKKKKEELVPKICEWSSSFHTYTCRFGIEMIMTHYLDTDFRSDLLDIPSHIRSEEYYVNMMIAWFYATALAKQWDAAIPYLENNTLDPWTHNKTIQKAKESFRITPEQKEYLKTLKR